MRTIYLFLALLCATVPAIGQGKRAVAPSIPLADSLFQLQQWQQAVPVYEAALKKTPDNSLAWNRLGFSYHNLSQLDKAQANYEEALHHKATPQLKTIVFVRLARVYSATGKIDKCKVSLDSALALGYGAVNELETQPDFANLRKDAAFENYKLRANLNAQPCLGIAQAREFDFWVGEWDAYVTGTNNLAGHSRIDMASGGCMILENWTSAGNTPFSGKSMNFVDPVTNKWKQIWVGSSGLNASEFLNGEYRDGAMRFEFEQNTPQGKSYVHFYFFNEGPDQVRQFHETSPDNKTWTTTYDFTYKRKK